MYSFLPKVTQQLNKFRGNPFVGPQNNLEVFNGEYFEVSPPAKEIQEFEQYQGKDFEVIPDYSKDMSYDPTASLDERTRALKYKELDRYRNEKGALPTGIIPELGYNPYFDNQYLPGINMFNQIITDPKKALSPDDMGGAGVMANTGLEPTPYLDQVMGKTETPYVMDFAPFTSEEEMLRYYNPRQQEPEITLDQIPTINDEKLMLLKKQQNAEALQLQAKSWMGNVFSGNNNNNPSDRVKNWMGGLFDSNIPSEKTNPTNPTNPIAETPKNKFGTPEAYYLGKSMLDATALINNMVQPQPPSIQMKLPHYERQRLNPEPYDTMRSEMRDQGTQAYRLQRENISQASDLMKGLAAVTSGTQQGLMQVGMQQAGAEQQIQGINQQISMQEQGAQTQILNQEATTNYQIQAQAQQFKDQMISAQLARLGDTAGAYAKYANMKEISNKQDIVNKAAIQSNNEIQNAMLQYQLQKDAMDSDEYKSAWSQHWNKRLDQMSIDKLSDQKYNLVKEYYGESTPRYGDYQRRAMDPVFVNDYYTKKNSADMFQKLYPGGVAPDRTKYTTDADYNAAVADFQRYQKDYNAYNTDKSYKTFEQEQDFWSAISNEKNEAAERKIFADTYMKDRGIFTSEQFMNAIQASLERSRQSLEI